MSQAITINRFIKAQETDYDRALNEIKKGKKQSHWMWYIFPQITGLGYSETAKFYAIKDLNEAKLYLDNPVLGARLIEISNALLNINGRTAHEIFGTPDNLKLKSCMTLFNYLQNTNPVFRAVLDKFFWGEEDLQTITLING